MTTTDEPTRVQRALNAEIYCGGQTYVRLREYLRAVLWELWDHPADFDPRHPFDRGEDWKMEIYRGLTNAGLCEGGFDEQGTPTIDYTDADELVANAINELFRGSR